MCFQDNTGKTDKTGKPQKKACHGLFCNPRPRCRENISDSGIGRQWGLFLSIFLVFFMLAGFCRHGHAYVLKGEHIVQLMLDAVHPPHQLLVRQQVFFRMPEAVETLETIETLEIRGPEAAWPGKRENKTDDGLGLPFDSVATDPKGIEQVTRFQVPGRFRSEIHSELLNRVHVRAAGTAVTVIDDRLVRAAETWEDRYPDLFLYRSRKEMVTALENSGINFSITSLGRYNGAICFVIGAQYPDETVPQLWVDKETFFPVRWIADVLKSESAAKTCEILFQNWQDYSGFWFPDQIVFYQAGNLIRRIAVQEVVANPSYSDALFDIGRLEQMYGQMLPEAADETDPEPIEIEQRILRFKEIYE